MPGKKGNITSKDYLGPLRRPGENLETATTQDGGKDSSSAPKESEKDKPSPAVASDLQVEDSKASQVSEEKPADGEGNKRPDLVEKEVLSEKEEKTNTDVSEVTKENAAEIASPTINENTESIDTDSEAVVKEPAVAKLSPFATEFVPRAAYNLYSAVNAPEFVPGSFSQQHTRPPLLRQRSNKAENEVMNCVKDVLFGLTQSPGELDSYVNTLVKTLRKWLSTLNSLKEVVDLIFEYSIIEPNFQYIAAKLCNLLSKEQNIVPKNGEKFRSVLMNRCRDEHLNREVSLQNPATATRLLGFAMFEAELFCNYRPLGESQPLKVFHRGLLEMLKTLIENCTEDCLQCVGKILKMTGFLLDDPQFMTDDEDRKEKVEKVFSDVETLSKESMLSDSVKGLLSQVIDLRATNWDDSTSVAGLPGSASGYPEDDSYYFSDYALGMDELNLDDDLAPVTSADQWSDYYHDETEETSSSHDTYSYYFPEEYNEQYSHEEDGEYFVEEDPEFDEIHEEFEKFMQEQEALFQ